jgi:ferric-dicitrate binding protein FerR (iron transport regulator)
MNVTLIHKYLSGECSTYEIKVIKKWLNSDAQNQEYMSAIKKIWDVSPGQKIYVDTESAWESVQRRSLNKNKSIEDERHNPSQQRRIYPVNSISQQGRRSFYAFAAVAVILIVVMFTQFISMNITSAQLKPLQQKMQEVVTEKGQRTTLRLSDDTRIYLNVDSRLQIPNDYNDKIREVYLEGEAYFDVFSNPEKPFLVHSGNGVTKVLGTEFDVRAYPVENMVQVVVAEGKVLMGSKEQGADQKVQLTQNRIGILSPGENVVVSDIMNLDELIGWKTGKLTFNGASLVDVKHQLERWYDIEISLQNEISSMSRRLTASFEKEPLTEVLTVMALALDVEYKREDRVVTIYRDK